MLIQYNFPTTDYFSSPVCKICITDYYMQIILLIKMCQSENQYTNTRSFSCVNMGVTVGHLLTLSMASGALVCLFICLFGAVPCLAILGGSRVKLSLFLKKSNRNAIINTISTSKLIKDHMYTSVKELFFFP